MVVKVSELYKLPAGTFESSAVRVLRENAELLEIFQRTNKRAIEAATAQLSAINVGKQITAEWITAMKVHRVFDDYVKQQLRVADAVRPTFDMALLNVAKDFQLKFATTPVVLPKFTIGSEILKQLQRAAEIARQLEEDPERARRLTREEIEFALRWALVSFVILFWVLWSTDGMSAHERTKWASSIVVPMLMPALAGWAMGREKN